MTRRVLESLWQRRKSMFEFLARTASQFWVAEKDGEIIAYARSIEHDGLQELTEFFVSPDQQSAGVGTRIVVPRISQHWMRTIVPSSPPWTSVPCTVT